MKYMTQQSLMKSNNYQCDLVSEVGASSQTCASVIFASLSLGDMSVLAKHIGHPLKYTAVTFERTVYAGD